MGVAGPARLRKETATVGSVGAVAPSSRVAVAAGLVAATPMVAEVVSGREE
jgi:hypothetical protein